MPRGDSLRESFLPPAAKVRFLLCGLLAARGVQLAQARGTQLHERLERGGGRGGRGGLAPGFRMLQDPPPPPPPPPPPGSGPLPAPKGQVKSGLIYSQRDK